MRLLYNPLPDLLLLVRDIIAASDVKDIVDLSRVSKVSSILTVAL
jgi:hypothetical protein